MHFSPSPRHFVTESFRHPENGNASSEHLQTTAPWTWGERFAPWLPPTPSWVSMHFSPSGQPWNHTLDTPAHASLTNVHHPFTALLGSLLCSPVKRGSSVSRSLGAVGPGAARQGTLVTQRGARGARCGQQQGAGVGPGRWPQLPPPSGLGPQLPCHGTPCIPEAGHKWGCPP